MLGTESQQPNSVAAHDTVCKEVPYRLAEATHVLLKVLLQALNSLCVSLVDCKVRKARPASTERVEGCVALGSTALKVGTVLLLTEAALHLGCTSIWIHLQRASRVIHAVQQHLGNGLTGGSLLAAGPCVEACAFVELNTCV